MGVEFRFQRGQCPAWSERTSGALLVIHLCVWLLHPDGVLFRVPSGAVEEIVCVPSPLKLASNPEYRRCGRGSERLLTMRDDTIGKSFNVIFTNGDLPTNPMSLRECAVCGGVFNP